MLYRTTGEGGSLRSPGRLAALAREGGSLRSPGRLRRPAPPSAGPAGAAAPAPHGAGPGPRPRYGGPPAQLPRLRRGFRGVLGLGPPRLRWAAAGLARRPCLRLGLAPGGAPGPCGAAGPARAPSSPRRVPLCRPLSGGPAIAMGRRASSLRGAAGAAAPPLFAAAAPRSGDYQAIGLPSRAALVAHPGHP